MDLSDTIRQWYINCQKESYSTPYIHFVTTKVWNKDIKQMNKDPNSPEWQDQRLLLIKLTKLIHQDSRTNIDITAATSKEMIVYQSVLPTKDYDMF